jgi:glyoxylase-like metal-dependent hydrolase (beta-lactamase superfamily II)
LVKQILSNLYSIAVHLPQSPLKNLNSYVLKGQKRNLLIDTGFNRPECLESLRAGLTELKLDMERTDILVTHCHADHCGLVPEIASARSLIYMNGADKALVDQYAGQGDEYWEKLDQRYISEGFPAQEMALARRLNPAKLFIPSRSFPSQAIKDGDKIVLDDFVLTCLSTPGHTPGHMCLYEERAGIMFTGDHILFDITPNITIWESLPDSLASYLDSLGKIRNYRVSLPLAAHRESRGGLEQRVDQLLAHHQARLQDCLNIIRAGGKMNAYQAASKMKWNITARDWNDFPLGQKRFAVGEAVSHLIHLVSQGKLRLSRENGVNYYQDKDLS